MNFSFILYSFLYFATFLFLGFGLTVLISPKRLLKYSVFLSPLIGFCLLTLAGYYLSNSGGTDSYYYWILLASLLFLVAATFKVWKQKLLTKLFSRELIIPIVIVIIVFFIVAIPALRQERMTTMTIGNYDIAQYTFGSELGQQLPREHEFFKYYGRWNPSVSIGLYLPNAFFSSLTGLEPYQLQMVSLYIFFIVMLLLVYILGREIFKYSNFISNVIILLLGLNSVLYYLIYEGFGPQIIGMGLALLVILFNVLFVRVDKFTDAARYIPILFLVLWGLTQTYGHMLVIIYALIIPYVLISCWKNRKPTKLLSWIAVNFIAALLIFGFSPQTARGVIDITFFMGGVVAGWFLPWTSPQKLIGVFPFLHPDSSFSNVGIAAVTIIASVIFLIVIVSGFVKLYKNDRENFFFAATTFPLIFFGAFIFSFWNIYRTYGGFGGYNQFKLISFFLPLISLSSFALFGDITFDIKNIRNIRSRLKDVIKSSFEYLDIHKKSLYITIIAVLIVANVASAGATLDATYKFAKVVPTDAIGLKELRNNNDIKSVNILADGGPWWNIMWEAYFLYPKKLYFEISNMYEATPLDGEWTLIRNTGRGSEKVLITVLPDTDTDTIKINPTYSLIKGAPRLTAKFGENWSVNEVTHRWTTADTASVIINTTVDNTVIDLNLKYFPLNLNNNLSIYLNGEKIKDCDNNSNCFVDGLLLKTGENVIEFKARLPAESPHNNDLRNLCYAFRLIQIEVVD